MHAQVAERARDLGIVARGFTASYTGVHRALLAGFFTLVGVRGEEGVYQGTRGTQFHLFPGSALARRKPRWVMAANIVETSRVFARRVAQIEPNWIEAAGAHLLKHEYLSPDWDEDREEVVARERVSLLGLILSANRIVNYGPIAPEESRRIFALEALAYRRLARRPAWLEKNDAALLAAQRVEERLRTRGLLLHPESLAEVYDRALPRQVSSGATLEFFSRHLTDKQRAALTLTTDDLFVRQPDAEGLLQFPERVQMAGTAIEVQYRFAPDEPGEGATLLVPVIILPLLSAAQVRSAIPGFDAPRIEAMLRSLPKDVRRSLIPIPVTARDYVAATRRAAGAMPPLDEWLAATRGVPPSLLHFQAGSVPAYLTPQVAVTEGGRELARGVDLNDLRVVCATAARERITEIAHGLYGADVWRSFELEELPTTVEVPTGAGRVTLFPTLSSHRGELRVDLEWSADEASLRWADGAVRLAWSVLDTQARGLATAVTASLWRAFSQSRLRAPPGRASAS